MKKKDGKGRLLWRSVVDEKTSMGPLAMYKPLTVQHFSTEIQTLKTKKNLNFFFFFKLHDFSVNSKVLIIII